MTDHALAASPYQSAVSCGLECGNSREDKIALEQMEQFVHLIKGRFQLPLLGRDQQTVLTDNQAVAQSHLESLNLEGSPRERVLGVQWEVSSDQLCVKINIPNKPYTRRGILGTTHSVFDPLGMVTPIMIEPKSLLRELCEYGWDDKIDDKKIKRWQDWLSSLC